MIRPWLPALSLLLLVTGACRSTPEVPPAPLRVMSYNIKHGLGNDGALDLARTAAVIAAARPDVVALQEVDRGCARSGGVDQAAWLGDELGMEHRFDAFMEYDGGEYGMAVLSRLPVISSESFRLPDGAEPRTALAVRVRLDDGHELVVVGIHLYATRAERLCQARRLAEFLARETAPVILAGDFNSEPHSPVMEHLRLRWTEVDKGEDHLTFDSRHPEKEIDYFLYRPAESLEVVAVDVLDEPLASDHRPLVLDVRLN